MPHLWALRKEYYKTFLTVIPLSSSLCGEEVIVPSSRSTPASAAEMIRPPRRARCEGGDGEHLLPFRLVIWREMKAELAVVVLGSLKLRVTYLWDECSFVQLSCPFNL